MNEINKLLLPITILIASIILGGFYYASEIEKQKSIERQQEIKMAEERRLEEKADNQKRAEVAIRSNCTTQATESAIELYKDYCMSNPYCTYKEGTFNSKQYENAYNTCLQSYGL